MGLLGKGLTGFFFLEVGKVILTVAPWHQRLHVTMTLVRSGQR